MADLKPIGSEKLQGAEKIARIMEIARYGETPKKEINVNETTDYTRVLADGNVYGIVKERNGYIVKKGIDESTLDYIDPMKNRKYHSSYSQALKKLNLIAGELNRLNENEQGTELFGEQKKFVLKTPKSSAPAPAPEPVTPAPEPVAPAPEPVAPAPEPSAEPMGDEAMPEPPSDDMMPDDMGTEEPTMDEPMGGEGDEGPVTLKQVQKLTGKLGQKLRAYASEQEMTSEDVKYVLNSILSAVDLNLLDETDKEDILSRFEGEEGDDEGSNYDEIGMEPTEPDTSDLDTGDEITSEPEVGESDYKAKINAIMDGMFTESKVDKILSKYFVETPEEKKMNESKKVQNYIKKKINKVSVMDEVKNLSETIEQELTSEFILRENENAKFIGKTNLKNLIFENEGKQIKVSPKGEIL